MARYSAELVPHAQSVHHDRPVLGPNPTADAIRELQRLRQWVTLRREMRSDGGPVLVPFHADGIEASTTDRLTWTSYSRALGALAAKPWLWHGLGFMLTARDPYTAISLLDCRDPVTGAIEPWAGDIAAAIDSYTEASVNGTGLTIVVRGKTVRGLHRIGQDTDGHRIRMFFRSHFVPLTGQHVAPLSREIVDGTAAIQLLEDEFACRGTQEVA